MPKKLNAAFMKKLKPDAALAKVVGEAPLPRTEVVKKMWEYIKAKKLNDGRNINADEILKPIFAGKKMVTMFEMNKLLGAHLKDA